MANLVGNPSASFLAELAEINPDGTTPASPAQMNSRLQRLLDNDARVNSRFEAGDWLPELWTYSGGISSDPGQAYVLPSHTELKYARAGHLVTVSGQLAISDGNTGSGLFAFTLPYPTLQRYAMGVAFKHGGSASQIVVAIELGLGFVGYPNHVAALRREVENSFHLNYEHFGGSLSIFRIGLTYPANVNL
jgi:hypothetical protein